MLFMVIETFRGGDSTAVGRRFTEKGRMLPEGVTYLESWIDPENLRCYQIMEASDAGRLDPWIAAWSDLVEFEIVPVVTSKGFWSRAV